MKKMYKIIVFLGIVFLILQEQAISEVIKNDNDRYCISSDEAVIQGLIPGQDIEALSQLPFPITKETGSGEDDGGEYVISIFKYQNFEVHIVRNKIDVVLTHSPAIKWVGGIQIGMQKSEVNAIIGKAKVAESEVKEQYLTCVMDADVYAILQYKSKKLVSIELVADRP